MDIANSQEDEYSGVEYKKLDIKESRMQLKQFISCTFIKCNFNGTYFQRCRFRDCVFKDCDLSLVNLKDSTFTNSRFEDSQLIGVNWTQSEWAGGKLIFKPVDFQNCVLNYSSFMGLNLEKIVMTQCIVHEASFEEANLSFANCVRSDFKDSRFVHTNLTGADFRGATDYLIDPTLNTLKKTKFSLPEAMSLLYSLDIVLNDPLSD